VDPHLALERLVKRTRGLSPRLARLSPARQAAVLRSADELLRHIGTELLRRDPTMTLLTFEAGGSISTLEEALVPALASWPGGRPTASRTPAERETIG
jgi:hypothetical protein